MANDLGVLYIISDGANSKIGVSSSFEKRLSAYNTHNPNYTVHKQYPATIDAARSLEGVVKQRFSRWATGNGKEWFAVPARVIEKYVDHILAFEAGLDSAPDTEAKFCGLAPTVEMQSLRQAILDEIHAIPPQKATERDKFFESRNTRENTCLTLFAKSFGIGEPEHLVDANPRVLRQGSMVPDFDHTPLLIELRKALSLGPDDHPAVIQGVREARERHSRVMRVFKNPGLPPDYPEVILGF